MSKFPRLVTQLVVASGVNSVSESLPCRLDEIVNKTNASDFHEQITACAVSHGMVPMLTRLAGERNWELPSTLGLLDRIWTAVNRTQFEYFAPVVRELVSRRTKIAMLKGADFLHTIYPSDMSRQMCDIDLLVRPPDVPLVQEVLIASGFVESNQYDLANLWVEPASSLDGRLHTHVGYHQLPPNLQLVRLEDLDPYANIIQDLLDLKQIEPIFSVVDGQVYLLLKVDVHLNVAPDISLSTTWHSPRSIEVTVFGDGTHVEMLGESTLVWYLATKFYHEFMVGGGACIRQFIDIAAAVKKYHQLIDWEYVLNVVRHYNFEPAIYYAAVHVNEMLGKLVPKEFIEAVNPSISHCGRLHDWGDFVPRLLGEVITVPIFE